MQEKQTFRYFETFFGDISLKPLLQETISRSEILHGQRRSKSQILTQ